MLLIISPFFPASIGHWGFGESSSTKVLDVLVDEDFSTCLDLRSLWMDKPARIGVKMSWGGGSPFWVNVTMHNNLSTLLSSSAELAVFMVYTENFNYFNTNTQLDVKAYKKCEQEQDSFKCGCDFEFCNVYMQIKLRDRNLMQGNLQLDICEIEISK